MSIKLRATNINVSEVDKLQEKIRSEIEKAEPKILQKLAIKVEQSMKANPVVFTDVGKSILQEMQGEYYAGSSVGSEDPADFSDVELIVQEITNNIEKTLKVVPTSEGIKWSALFVSDEFVGFGDNSIVGRPTDPGKPGTLPWISFFLGGAIEDNLFWVDRDTKEKLGISTNHLGRFGAGFLIHAREGFKQGVLAGKKHPISGKPGRPWFEGFEEKVTSDPRFMSLYIEPAKKQATDEVLTEIINKLTRSRS